MVSFSVTFGNVLLMLVYLLPGFFLYRAKKVKPEHLSSVSVILLYICGYALYVNALYGLEPSPELFRKMGLFLLFALAGETALMLLIRLFLGREKRKMFSLRMMSIASVMGNVGFFGLPVISALFPNNPEVACYTTMYMLSMNCIVYSFGIYFLTGDKKYASLSAIVKNPAVVGLVFAIPIYIFGLSKYIPEAFQGGISLIGSMSAPLCMFVLGIRLASRPIKEIFTSWHVYPVIVLKLLIYPLFTFALVCFLPLPDVFKATVLILSATPCATVVQTLPERYQGDADLAARALFVSTILCFLTIPLFTFLL